MAIRKIEIRPPGTGDYSDVLYPKTSADIVMTTDGNVQTDINGLKTDKADKSYVDTELAKKSNIGHTHTKSNITDFTHTHGKADITDFSHSHSKSEITDFPTLGTAASKNVGTASGNVPILGANGKLDVSVLPAIAITDTFPVATETDMLALDAQVGDVCIRTDLRKSFILKAEPASTLENWEELLTPTDAVLSVNGKTGVVTITKSDVGLGNVTNESKATMFTSPAFTGIPTAPTAPNGTNTTQIATTAFVQNALAAGGYGDMLKSQYDDNDDGKVNSADSADTLTGLTATITELNYVAGVTSNIQTQLNGKAAISHTHTKSQITDMPTKLSQFINDAGFITKSLTIGTVQPSDGTLWFKEI